MKWIIVFFLILSIALPLFTLAANGPKLNLNLDYPSFGGFKLDNQSNGLVQIIGWLYYAIVGLSGAAAFLMLLWGGIQWLSSSGNPSLIGDARDRMQNALLGLLLVLSSVLIIRIINPELSILREPTLQELSREKLKNPFPEKPEYRSIFAGTNALGSGSCEYGQGICSPENLLKYFPDPLVAAQASKVCNAESTEEVKASNVGCLSFKGDTQEALQKGSRDYSIGLFQINLLAHCFDESNKSPFVDVSNNSSVPGNCAVAPGKDAVVASCIQRFSEAKANIEFAKQLFQNNQSKWQPVWGAAMRCGIP